MHHHLYPFYSSRGKCGPSTNLKSVSSRVHRRVCLSTAFRSFCSMISSFFMVWCRLVILGITGCSLNQRARPHFLWYFRRPCFSEYVGCVHLVDSPHFPMHLANVHSQGVHHHLKVYLPSSPSLKLSREFHIHLILPSSRARFQAAIPEGHYLPELTPAQRLAVVG
ncbi:hypothetical protein CY34DRAFT_466763 [Suillus luteus UH-Slu-Lm8-n1]|uniref:Uncharacterized protein n=1 Tax=Suillus luteus UH-Slu-Lm8-n1 TaxID=930992 RepID=A0A0C9ZIS0_9AGAM|nr:hypothetical protein CY34DRAFT_466763 [Suillus luteus UH-Slu-Lm8-n1]